MISSIRAHSSRTARSYGHSHRALSHLKSRAALITRCGQIQRQCLTTVPHEYKHEDATQRFANIQKKLLAQSPQKMTSLVTQNSTLYRDSFNHNKQTVYAPSPVVTLPSQKTLSREEFENHPLFKITKEKKKVFSELAYLCINSEAMQDYDNFLKKLKDPDWHTSFQSSPVKLGYFSLIAFFEGKIDCEELFIMHIVAEAYSEFLSSKIKDVTIQTLSPDTAVNYLQEAGFPLFSPQPNMLSEFFTFLPKNYYSQVITNSKSKYKLKNERLEFLTELTKLSLVKRACVEYTLNKFNAAHESSFSLEMGAYFHTGFRIGFKNIKKIEQEGSIVLLSPQLSIDILRRTSALSSQLGSEHIRTFGYSEDDSLFYRGIRVISIPSPLFSVEFVHDYKNGPKGLGIYHHDISYHLPLEANNPHVKQMVNIAKKIKTFSPAQKKEFFPKETAEAVANRMIDRETYVYLKYPPKIAFFKWFANNILNEFKKWPYDIGNEIAQEIFSLIQNDLMEIDAEWKDLIRKEFNEKGWLFEVKI